MVATIVSILVIRKKWFLICKVVFIVHIRMIKNKTKHKRMAANYTSTDFSRHFPTIFRHFNIFSYLLRRNIYETCVENFYSYLRQECTHKSIKCYLHATITSLKRNESKKWWMELHAYVFRRVCNFLRNFNTRTISKTHVSDIIFIKDVRKMNREHKYPLKLVTHLCDRKNRM